MGNGTGDSPYFLAGPDTSRDESVMDRIEGLLQKHVPKTAYASSSPPLTKDEIRLAAAAAQRYHRDALARYEARVRLHRASTLRARKIRPKPGPEARRRHLRRQAHVYRRSRYAASWMLDHLDQGWTPERTIAVFCLRPSTFHHAVPTAINAGGFQEMDDRVEAAKQAYLHGQVTYQQARAYARKKFRVPLRGKPPKRVKINE